MTLVFLIPTPNGGLGFNPGLLTPNGDPGFNPGLCGSLCKSLCSLRLIILSIFYHRERRGIHRGTQSFPLCGSLCKSLCSLRLILTYQIHRTVFDYIIDISLFEEFANICIFELHK